MSEQSHECSTSSVVMRCYAPPVLAEPYRMAFSGMGSPSVRLGRQLPFLETLLRYLVALQVSECSSLRLQLPPAWLNLLGRLHKPTLGHWYAAAQELASVLIRVDGLLVPELPRVFWNLDRGRLRETAVLKSLGKVKKTRNQLFHGHLDTIPGGHRADKIIDELVPAFRAIFDGMRFLRSYPLLVVDECKTNLDGKQQCKVLRFRGLDVEPVTLEGPARPVPQGIPMLVGDDGDILLLAPFLVYGHFHPQTPRHLRLLHSWRQSDGAIFSDPSSNERHRWQDQSCAASSASDFLECFLHPDHIRLRGILTEQQVQDLRDQRSERLPRIAHYEIGPCLGRGASSTVYLADSTSPHVQPARAAIKVLKHELAPDPMQRSLLKREYQVMSGLDVPAIARVYALEEDPQGLPCLVMEYVDGTNLEWLVKDQPFSPEKAIKLLLELLKALDVTHRKHIVHRDLKPSNLLLDSEGKLRIIDFGIALNPEATRLTQAVDVVGTPAFAAPEQMEGREADARSDIFATGRLLGYLVSGSTERTSQIKALPPALRPIYRKASDPSPEARYPDVMTMARDLIKAQRDLNRGAPLGEGAIIHDSIRLQHMLGQVVPGVFAYKAQDIQRRTDVGVLLEEASRASKLLAAYKACPARVLAELDKPLLERADGVHYCVIPSKSILKQGKKLLEWAHTEPDTKKQGTGAAPQKNTDALHPAKATAIGVAGTLLAAGALAMGKQLMAKAARGAAPPSNKKPPYLAGIRLPQASASAPLQARTAQALGLVLLAQAHALGLLALNQQSWRQFQSRTLFAPLWITSPSRKCSADGKNHFDQLRRPALHQAFELLNATYSGNHGPDSSHLQAASIANQQLLKAAIRLHHGLDVKRLEPWLKGTTSGWYWLSFNAGKPHYKPIET